MSERRPATTIAELDIYLDIHLGIIMDAIKNMQAKVDSMSNLLATKVELDNGLQALRKEMHEKSLRSTWRRVTEFAIGVTALAAALSLVIAVARSANLI